MRLHFHFIVSSHLNQVCNPCYPCIKQPLSNAFDETFLQRDIINSVGPSAVAAREAISNRVNSSMFCSFLLFSLAFLILVKPKVALKLLNSKWSISSYYVVYV